MEADGFLVSMGAKWSGDGMLEIALWNGNVVQRWDLPLIWTTTEATEACNSFNYVIFVL